MTAQELQKRNERAQTLRVIQVDHDSFYVESSEGKICYKVMLDDESADCTCGDFNRNVKNDPNFRCKHIMSVINCLPDGDYDKAQFLEKRKPKLDERFIITLEGKDFVTYPGLLDLGHQKGILKIEVEPVQLATKENEHFAVCKAIVILSAIVESCLERLVKWSVRNIPQLQRLSNLFVKKSDEG